MPREPRCLSSVRRFVRDLAADWGAAPDVPELAELLVSELATNALSHTVPGDGDAIRITVAREGELLAVDVHDTCPDPPRPRLAGRLDTGGRGLAIVRSFAHDWGCLPGPSGKTVWFRLRAWPTG